MNKTKIEWCDQTWNPVTGCLHGCEYCYARRIARRFCHDPWNTVEDGINHYVGLPMQNEHYKGGKIDPYPYGFDPTFHSYRLEELARKTKPQNIFVCSMADLFGSWVPDKWIQEVFKACEAAPQHNYLFLTKNPYRYLQLLLKGYLIGGSHVWLGTTLNGEEKLPFNARDSKQNFISLEPILSPVSNKFPFTNIQWVIIGAETGNRKGKVIPKKEWVDDIVAECRKSSVPVFMKNSLLEIMGADFVQEYPTDLLKVVKQ